ncbi:MAG TPA: ABC transporter permease [Puia sp.]|jgi:putative ABC transport system permease protein|nr:ABC transporter permease [Puia sp.]
MLENYFKIAYRNLTRNKAFSFINILGLAIGLATCVLMILYIFSELGYDKQNKNADRIFRIAYQAVKKVNPEDKSWASTAAPIAWGLKSDMPEVEQSTRLLKFPSLDKMLLKYEHGKEKKIFYETNGYYVDSTFFQIFSYDFLFGNALTSLNEPNSIVISEQIAQKIFGNKNPVNKSITVGLPYGDFSYTVKGVFDDSKIKSHIPAHFFLSMRNGDVGTWVQNQTNWATNNIFHTYVKLKEGANAGNFEKKLQEFIVRRGGKDLKEMGILRQLFIQPVTDIYLHSDLDNEIAPNGNITYLYILGSIALFVLLIACINFMNLSTARSLKRAKEVGVRKVLGAEKRSLVYQFLGESTLTSCLALLLALVIAYLVLPFFNNLTQKNITLFDQPGIWIWIILLTLGTGLLSGIYPAFYLSSFRPITVLKGKLLNNFSGAAIRKGLVVFQFVISICLILGVIVIQRQLQFMNDQQLGFNKNQQIILPLQSPTAVKNYEVLKTELLKNPGIKNVTSGSTYPGIASVDDMIFYAEGKSVKDVIDISLANVDIDYFETLGLKLVAGRGFSKEFTADSNSIVLNETALRELGYPLKTALGRKVYFDFQGSHNTMYIVGVVRNFNFESLYNTIKPFAFNTIMGNKHSYVIANVSAKSYTGILQEMATSWNNINPGVPFVYSFLDKDFQKNYEKDQRASGIVWSFTVIAILIACLGLFGLSAFAAEQRFKEIGVRKVLGASVISIIGLLSKDFIKIVLVAILIATPIGWYFMNKWLGGFAYRTPVSWWIFAITGFLAILIALITVSFQAIRAAIANQVKSLHSE